MYKLDPQIWFDARKVEYEPKHFVRSRTKLTKESKKWIEEKLVGRYYFYSGTFELDASAGQMYILSNDFMPLWPSFEDPAEAMFYELTWS